MSLLGSRLVGEHKREQGLSTFKLCGWVGWRQIISLIIQESKERKEKDTKVFTSCKQELKINSITPPSDTFDYNGYEWEIPKGHKSHVFVPTNKRENEKKKKTNKKKQTIVSSSSCQARRGWIVTNPIPIWADSIKLRLAFCSIVSFVKGWEHNFFNIKMEHAPVADWVPIPMWIDGLFEFLAIHSCSRHLEREASQWLWLSSYPSSLSLILRQKESLEFLRKLFQVTWYELNSCCAKYISVSLGNFKVDYFTFPRF